VYGYRLLSRIVLLGARWSGTVTVFHDRVVVSVNVCHLLSRYVQIPASEVDTDLLQDAARKENAPK
jgi:hypothetical protein